MERKIKAMHVYKGREGRVGDYHLAIDGIESVEFLPDNKISVRLSPDGSERICEFGRKDFTLNSGRDFVVTAEGIDRVEVLYEGGKRYEPLADARTFDCSVFIQANHKSVEDQQGVVDYLMRKIAETRWKVSREAVTKCVEAWAQYGSAGVRDEENGIYLQTRCVALMLEVQDLNPLCEVWQSNYFKPKWWAKYERNEKPLPI